MALIIALTIIALIFLLSYVMAVSRYEDKKARMNRRDN